MAIPLARARMYATERDPAGAIRHKHIPGVAFERVNGAPDQALKVIRARSAGNPNTDLRGRQPGNALKLALDRLAGGIDDATSNVTPVVHFLRYLINVGLGACAYNVSAGHHDVVQLPLQRGLFRELRMSP